MCCWALTHALADTKAEDDERVSEGHDCRHVGQPPNLAEIGNLWQNNLYHPIDRDIWSCGLQTIPLTMSAVVAVGFLDCAELSKTRRSI